MTKYRVLIDLTYTNDLRMIHRLEADHHADKPEAERVPVEERGYQRAYVGDVLDNLQPVLVRKWLAKGWIEPVAEPTRKPAEEPEELEVPVPADEAGEVEVQP